MKYNLNIQLFADTSKTIIGSGEDITTFRYTPNYWQYSTNGTTWNNLRSASTSGTITNQTRLKNLVDYGSKVNKWTSTSTKNTTYSAITLPAYPTKADLVLTTNEIAYVYISGLSVSDTYSGDGWGSGGEEGIILNNTSTRAITTTTSYTPKGYYDNPLANNIRYGGAGDSYTPTARTTEMYVGYDTYETSTYGSYSSITLPYITRPGYIVEGYYDGTTRVGGEGDTYTPTTQNKTLTVNFVVSTKIYIKDGGTIKEISSCYYKENGSWVSKTVDEMYTILNNLTYYKDGG